VERELPRTASSKIDKQVLTKRALASATASTPDSG
jgi:hypothetical protein